MMPRTLFAKLALSLTLLLLGIGLLYVLLSTSLANHYQQVFLQNLNRDLAQNLIAERGLISDGALDEAALKETFNHYMMVNPSIEIYLLDTAGDILSYSAEPGKVKRARVDMGPIQSFLSGQTFPLLGNDPRSFDRNKVFSVAPVPSLRGSQGYLYVVLRGEDYDRTEQLFQGDFLAQLSGAAVLVSLVVGLVVGLLLFRLLTRRLHDLTRLMDRFRESNFTEYQLYQVRTDRQDEIEQLGEHYNQMAERIRELLTDLTRQDEVRRELVANVSHDLRTPLAALQGYIETLKLKSDSLDATTRAQYLDVAHAQSLRLTRLVDELFELAKLDARETQLHREPFAPAELVQDVIQKFQLAAAEREARLGMECNEPLPFVEADIGLIERVLENFLSNSLRYTQRGGKIRIALTRRPPGVEIQVRDDGDGIQEKDLPYIFDRFYQAENKERSGDHAGLGLAIAQRIINLHGENIEVQSAPGRGTVFTFCLPAWDPSSQ